MASSAIDVLAYCGDVDAAREMFVSTTVFEHDVVLGNAMMTPLQEMDTQRAPQFLSEQHVRCWTLEMADERLG